MRLKNKKSAYYFIPVGLIIKVALTLFLLNLPGGCRERREDRMNEKDVKPVTTALSNDHFLK